MKLKTLTNGAQLLLGLLAISFVGLFAYAAERWLDYDQLQRETVQVRKTLGEAIELHNQFLLDHDLSVYRRALGFLVDLKQEVRLLQEHERAEGIDTSKIDDFTQLLDRFGKKMNATADAYIEIGLNENSGLRGEFRAAAHELLATSQLGAHADFEILLLQLRRREKDYLLRFSPRYLKIHGELMDQARIWVKAQPKFNPEERQEILDKLDRYQSSFQLLVLRTEALGLTPADGLRGEIRVLSEEMPSVFNALYDELSETLRTRNTRMMVLVGSALLLLMLVVLVMIRRVILRLYAGVDHLSSEVGRVVHSQDYSYRITAHSRDELHSVTDDFNTLIDHFERALQDLNSAQSRLMEVEKMAALGELVSGVAHEVNTPLGVAITSESHLKDKIEALRQDLGQGRLRRSSLEKLLGDAGEYLDIIDESLKRAASIIESFKQISVRSHWVERSRFNLNDLIYSVRRELDFESGQRGVLWEIEATETLDIISYNSALSQVLLAIYDNAVQHAPIDEEPLTIRTTVQVSGKALTIVIEDDGSGIAADVLDRVFDPFFTTNRARGSTGLGLSLVYNLVEFILEGHVSMTSTEGKGTRVELQLGEVLCLDEKKATLRD